MLFKNVLAMIGNTPIVGFRLNDFPNIKFYIKLEEYNLTGSIKDRTALAIINQKINNGELIPGKTILDASSGSFACSMACLGQIFGFPVTVVTGSKLTKTNHAFLEYFGVEIISHGDVTMDGYIYCRDVLMVKKPKKFCFLDQLNNWESPKIHYQTTGPEILRDLPDVVAIAASMGSGATLHGVSKYIKEKAPKVKIIASTAKSGTKIAGTFLEGVDYVSPFIKDLWDKNWIDFTTTVSYSQAISNVKLLSYHGFFVGLQTGGVFQAMLEAVKTLKLKGKVLIISGDTGWKNMDKLMALT